MAPAARAAAVRAQGPLWAPAPSRVAVARASVVYVELAAGHRRPASKAEIDPGRFEHRVLRDLLSKVKPVELKDSAFRTHERDVLQRGEDPFPFAVELPLAVAADLAWVPTWCTIIGRMATVLRATVGAERAVVSLLHSTTISLYDSHTIGCIMSYIISYR